jgi:hypothetical protein
MATHPFINTRDPLIPTTILLYSSFAAKTMKSNLSQLLCSRNIDDNVIDPVGFDYLPPFGMFSETLYAEIVASDESGYLVRHGQFMNAQDMLSWAKGDNVGGKMRDPC